jgi:tRNA threonylcarbamoyl adenosine modification protein (Sua5/YciO/YrdC/YwlC family)
MTPSASLAAAAGALRAGAVVGIPTDTVYGLAADPSVPGATAALFALKGRPEHVELPVLVADVAQAEELAGPSGLGPAARLLAERFWPGALTVVVGRRPGVTWELGGTGGTIGLRCPASEPARSLCTEVGPLATTSANRHGEPPLVTAAELVAAFGPELVVVDGGRCAGAPSTVVDVTGWPARCLRPGAVRFAEVEAALAGLGGAAGSS